MLFFTDETQSEGGGIAQGAGIGNYEELCHIVLDRSIFLLAAVKGPDKPWHEDVQGSDDEIDRTPVKSEDCYRYVQFKSVKGFKFSCHENVFYVKGTVNVIHSI